MIRPTILALGLILTSLVSPLCIAVAEVPAKVGDKVQEERKAERVGHQKDVEEAAHEPDILAFQPSLMLATMLVFGFLALILWRYAWGPLEKALLERERKQEETVRAAEHARTESERLLAEHRRQMETAAEQIRQMLEDARKQADTNANTIIEKAKTEAEAEGMRAKREIGAARDQALVEIWTKVADTSVAVAGKLLSTEMTPDDHRRLVDAATRALPSVVGANGHGGHAG